MKSAAFRFVSLQNRVNLSVVLFFLDLGHGPFLALLAVSKYSLTRKLMQECQISLLSKANIPVWTSDEGGRIKMTTEHPPSFL